MFKQTLSAALLGGAALAAQAAAITPIFGDFGSLEEATFGGTGIPNNAVAYRTIGSGGSAATIGLTAHQRYGNNPALTNDGAGVFTALAGVDTNPPSPGNPFALWNFAFYVGGFGASAYTYEFLYDFDPSAGTEAGEHGRITVPGESISGGAAEDSWNLGMDFLAVSVPGAVVRPLYASFDPNALGQYTFSLTAYSNNVAVGTTAIQVNVVAGTQAVPEPGSLALVGAALLGLAAVRRRKA